MSDKQIVFLSVFFVFAMGFVLRMIIKHRLREVYAVVWVAVVLAIPLNILMFPRIAELGRFVGIQSAFNFTVFIGFVVCLGLLLHFSILNSGMQRTIKNTVQKMAILEDKIKDLEGRNNGST